MYPNSPPLPAGPPPVLVWYRAYCIVAALIYVACAVLGGVFVGMADEIGRQDNTPPGLWVAYGAMLLLIGLALAAAFVVALFLPRKRWAWVCHMVLICLGLTGCFFPASLPLLLFFIKPETQAYFNS